MVKIKIYTTQHCIFCKRAKDLLNSQNLKYEEIDITNNELARNEIMKKYNWMTVPAIFFENEFIGGFDELYEKLEK